MDFVSLDFETANYSNRGSVCAVGIAIVKNKLVVEEKSWLVKPNPQKDNHFHPFNVSKHGITEENVKDEPEFDVIWGKLEDYLKDNLVVAHNASFDISVLKHVLDSYNFSYPKLTYLCSMKAAKRVWPQLLNYRLNTIADFLGIEFLHHDPLEDARTSAEIINSICNEIKCSSLDEFSGFLKISLGELFEGGYNPCSIASSKSSSGMNVKDITSENDEFNVDNPLYSKKVIFTGSLETLTRREAMQKVVDLGGKIGKGVTLDINYLVMGEQGYSRLKDGKLSNKMKKAKRYIEKKNIDIEIISEDDFLKMVN